MTDPRPFALPESDRDRLADLGTLAGPLVHELKNPLSAILLNCELLRESSPFRSKVAERAHKRLLRIEDSARGLERIIQSFLAFARPSRPEREAVDLNLVLEELIIEQHELLDAAEVNMVFRPDPDIAAIPGDPQQLRSVFLNVIDNAREALLERAKDRRILIVTRSAPGMVKVMIANNGPPLADNVAAHLFEPFRSTKETGTGLGLAITRRLVELHHGTVQVSSDRDQGVSFSFEFPTILGPARTPTALSVPLTEATVRNEPDGDDPDKTTRPKSGSRPPTTRSARRMPRTPPL